MGASFFVTFAVFSFASSSAQISFPARTFTLPVRTGLLVNCPLFFGALAITIFHLAWTYMFLLPAGAHYPPGLFTMYWVAALMTFQAMIWCLADFPKSLVVVLVSAMVLFVRLALVLVEENDAGRAVICLSVILPVAYLCARLGISQQRHGPAAVSRRRAGEGRPNLRQRSAPQKALRRRCSSPALDEARRNAVAPLISLGIGAGLVWAGFVRFGSQDRLGFIAIALFRTFTIFLTLWAFTSGLLLARDAVSRSLALSSFIATRPISTGELAFAKVKLAGLLTLAGWLVYGVGVFVWFSLCWQPGQSVTQRDAGGDGHGLCRASACLAFGGRVVLLARWQN